MNTGFHLLNIMKLSNCVMAVFMNAVVSIVLTALQLFMIYFYSWSILINAWPEYARLLNFEELVEDQFMYYSLALYIRRHQ